MNTREDPNMTVTFLRLTTGRLDLIASVARAALTLPLAALSHPGRPLAIRRTTGEVVPR